MGLPRFTILNNNQYYLALASLQLMDDGTLLFFDNGNLNHLTNELEAITKQKS